MYPSRLDDKGRIKLPAPFQEYLSGLPEKKLFVTSLDGLTAQVYPLQIWRANEKFFESYTDDPEAASATAFVAADLGAEAQMDSQGRIVFPAELRRELGIENQAVRVFAYKGRIEVLSERIYEERKRAAYQTASENLRKLEKAGLK
jgi:MraZ protein